ncbi:D-ribose-binding periplasmic protein precursor [Serratia marcescens]|uniref:D-ribose-binding periplasmic protein n=1 Tax=Serratia marcescens TaxID=615 RepID=A0A379Z2U7_SERMA|nr:D-ribose-binding periplasmic protein precursor [Serratia marcescens]
MFSLFKKTLPFIVAGGMLAASQVALAKQITIGMSFQEMNNDYFVTMKQALDQAAADIGAKVYVADARHDVAKQIGDVEDMLQKKVDILLINPTDSVGVQSAVISAHKAGAVVVAIDAQAEGPLDSFVGSENYDAGFQAGEYLAKALGGKGKVAILDGIPVVPILERVRGFEAAMKKIPRHQDRHQAKRQAGTRHRADRDRKHAAVGAGSGGHLQCQRRRRARRPGGDRKQRRQGQAGERRRPAGSHQRDPQAEFAVHRHFGAVPARPAAHRARHCAGPLLGRHGAENRAGQSEADRPQQCGRL